MTRFDAYNVRVLILAKKKSFIKYKYTIMIAGTYYVDHIPGTECELNLIKIPQKKERIKKNIVVNIEKEIHHIPWHCPFHCHTLHALQYTENRQLYSFVFIS